MASGIGSSLIRGNNPARDHRAGASEDPARSHDDRCSRAVTTAPERRVGAPTFERVARRTPTAPRRRGTARRVVVGLGLIVAIYLVVRGIAEPFLIDVDDPDTYRSDWGGPSLIGVLAVHSGPALVIAAAAVAWFVRRRDRDAERSSPP